MVSLPIETILQDDPDRTGVPARRIGVSVEGREIAAYALGRGPTRISLIGGCHADEPVGPAMLARVIEYLASRDPDHPLLERFRWLVIPHLNPDGARRNAAWTEHFVTLVDHTGAPDRGYDPALYVQHVVRELPGDDIEFGFPRHSGDAEARPENRAAAACLTSEGPFHLHGTFHGMGFAPGPWFLLEPGWVDRTSALRTALRRRVRAMGYSLFDVDRQGEKGFRRIDEGFSTRPDSRAMAAHFRALGDDSMAGRFRPSSMELVRRLGSDPLTLVSEMPLFTVPAEPGQREVPIFKPGTEGRRELHARLQRITTECPLADARLEMRRLGIRPMPIRDQMRLQLSFLNEALEALANAR